MTVAQARSAAIKELGALHGGEDPAPAIVTAGPTFGEALALHMDRLRRKGGRPRSVSSIESQVARHLGDWTARRLVDISRTDCRTLHERLTDDSGPYLANRVMRYARAVYNTALKEHGLPANPTVAVHWNKEERCQEPIPWADARGGARLGHHPPRPQARQRLAPAGRRRGAPGREDPGLRAREARAAPPQ